MFIEFKLNGKMVSLDVKNSDRLIDILRENFGLTSVKEGCSEGECGACTILMNNKAVPSCSVLAFQARNCEIITLEGLRQIDGEIDKIQESFASKGAVQCGYCTPGMIMSAKALLMENPSPSEEEIRRAISGNLCRCTGYSQIIDAIKDASEKVGV